MAVTAETSLHHPALALQAAILARPATAEQRLADAIRALALDAIETAGCGSPGLPMGMADAATVLWTRFHKFDSADPHWPDRDRFVLSAGSGAMLLYALLHLTGHAGMGIAVLKRYGQLDGLTAGGPMFGQHPAIEATTGPLGQGLATGVGLALAERLLAGRFGRSLVDHRTWVVVSDADLMDGVSHEAASIAGRFRLEKLTVLWDDSAPPADPGVCGEDPLKRFAGANWAVKRVDGHDFSQIAAALSMAMRSKKPTLIACRTLIGFAALRHHAGNGNAVRTEFDAARAALGWEHDAFEVPEDVAVQWHRAGARGATARRGWLKRLARHSQRAEFERAIAGRLPDEYHEVIASLKTGLLASSSAVSTTETGYLMSNALMAAIPDMVGGSAETGGSDAVAPPGSESSTQPARVIAWGGRSHGMAAALNGLALHSGLIACGCTTLASADAMRPALRLAAMMKLRVVYTCTDDSIGVGAYGPSHQPTEQLAALRAIPNLLVFRPADAIETAECWELALRRNEGPSILVLSRQALPNLRTENAENRCARGGYMIAEAPGPRQATLIASGSEVAVALAARDLLAASSIPVAVVSLPCWERFAQQDEAYRAQVLGGAARFGIEAASEFGWSRWLGPDGCFIGMSGFGASGPADDLYRHFGITPEAVAAAVRKRLG
jgi:transketolase